MPVVIYVFSLCTFAFGLSEFILAGLVSAIAADFSAAVAAVGTTIAVYALGAAIGAPLLTALVSHWRDRSVLSLAMAILALGSLLMSLASSLPMLLAVRFIVGMAHGVFMAVASDAATRLVKATHAGRALSLVWLGLTLALAFGVPIGTSLGSLWSWRAVLLSIGALSLCCVLGLLYLMPRQEVQPRRGASPWAGLRALRHPQLLITAGIAGLVSVAVFSFFTFISPYLLQITRVPTHWLSVAMLLFGLCSIAGNLLGGYLVDVTNVERSALIALLGLALTLGGLYYFRALAIPMLMLIGTLGLLFFTLVTLLTLRLLKLAQRYIPASTAVAAGLNIASFNLGTALGGGLGSITIAYMGLPPTSLVGVVAALLAIALLRWQTIGGMLSSSAVR